ncbi:Zn-dependent alcohol dehydrogenase [Gymnodinialimonas sp. 57CJ19]|uniref:Zn-dependent alcohol dehydrogenase n=1 Tax=Gymnodinialimonas sp. 57CJ19 TaxID=3138498 RepID=UPI0031344DB0
MPKNIRAAVCHSHGAPLSIETVTLRDPGPGEVEVTLEAVAICHSDISYMEGAWGGDLPAIYGHEAAGKVTAVGAGVALQEGDRVIVTLAKSCGQCPSCASAQPMYCAGNTPEAQVITTPNGAPVVKAMNCGAFAEAVVVDASQTALIGDDIPSDVACLLACGVPTGLGAAINTAKVKPGDKVVVIGAGGVGLNAIQGARIAGAARIVAMDLEEKKLADAIEFGATDTLPAQTDKPWKALSKLLGGTLADHVFVSVGAIPAYESALRLLAPRGTAYAVGMTHNGETTPYEPVIFAATGQGIRGSFLGEVVLKRDIPWMVDLYSQGRLKLDELISARWSLDQINEAISDTNTGQARRNVITF